MFTQKDHENTLETYLPATANIFDVYVIAGLHIQHEGESFTLALTENIAICPSRYLSPRQPRGAPFRA
jgi:hypothetical protein